MESIMIDGQNIVTIDISDSKVMKKIISIISPILHSRVMSISKKIIHSIAINFRVKNLVSKNGWINSLHQVRDMLWINAILFKNKSNPTFVIGVFNNVRSQMFMIVRMTLTIFIVSGFSIADIGHLRGVREHKCSQIMKKGR